MDSSILHWAARRYLTDRYDELCRTYARLPRQHAADRYSAQAMRTFPRYHVVQAILVEVERLDPDHLPDVPQLARSLDWAAHVAQSPSTENLDREGMDSADPDSTVAAEAMLDERRRFSSFLETWLSTPDLEVEPLATGGCWRRKSRRTGGSGWRHGGACRGTCWHPMLSGSVPPDVLVLTEAAMHSRAGAARVRKAVEILGSNRVVELREGGPDYRLDLDLVSPVYNGAEGVWADDSLEWVAVASHEGTVAFGGQLAVILPGIWKTVDDWRWSGW